jgi:hypothetical protein
MEKFKRLDSRTKKRVKPSERKLTTALFMLRCIQIGLRLPDLDDLTMGEVFDIFIENGNDQVEYDQIATQEDIDNW